MHIASKIATATAAVGLSLAATAGAGQAAPIINFSQTANTNTITATAAGGVTTISGSNIAVSVSQYLGGGAPFSAQLTLNATSTNVATVTAGSVDQMYNGSFSITQGGTNYLSGTFTGASLSGLLGGSSLTLSAAQPPNGLTFTSSVIAAALLGDPRGLSFAFANVSPLTSISGGTIASFTSTVAGNANAEPVPAPEPASLALLGAGLLGLGVARRARRKETISA